MGNTPPSVAGPVAGAVARLATERPGSTLLGRASHPPEIQQDFASFSRSTILPYQHVLVARRISWVAQTFAEEPKNLRVPDAADRQSHDVHDFR